MRTISIKSVYMPPQITKVVTLEIEHPLLADSIIPDDQEVVIERQDPGISKRYEYWD